MQINALNSVNNVKMLKASFTGGGYTGSDDLSRCGRDCFEEEKLNVSTGKELPEGKALLLKKGPSVGLINLLLLPLRIFSFDIEYKPKLVDIKMNNLSEKEIKLIQKGKLINYVPVGFEIKDGEVKNYN